MKYFLKKSNLKKGTYLQIYESYYDPDRKCGAHHSYKALGYVQDLIASGIEDTEIEKPGVFGVSRHNIDIYILEPLSTYHAGLLFL